VRELTHARAFSARLQGRVFCAGGRAEIIVLGHELAQFLIWAFEPISLPCNSQFDPLLGTVVFHTPIMIMFA